MNSNQSIQPNKPDPISTQQREMAHTDRAQTSSAPEVLVPGLDWMSSDGVTEAPVSSDYPEDPILAVERARTRLVAHNQERTFQSCSLDLPSLHSGTQSNFHLNPNSSRNSLQLRRWMQESHRDQSWNALPLRESVRQPDPRLDHFGVPDTNEKNHDKIESASSEQLKESLRKATVGEACARPYAIAGKTE